MSVSKKIIIFKNDAVGDLVQSLQPIYNIIKHNTKNDITIYLSERSKDFSFFFNYDNVKINLVNYNLSLTQKTKIFFKLFSEKIDSIYILTPKTFYFYLPFFFKKIRFYGLCINSINNYKRPPIFLRKYLYQYCINDRGSYKKRLSTMDLQNSLTKDLNFNENFKIPDLPKFKSSASTNIVNYIYFHLKIDNFKKMGWGFKELKMLFDEFLKYRKNVIFTKDIEINNDLIDYKKYFNFFDFLTGEEITNNSGIYLFNNISGSNLYHIINNADKVISFHGMMTNLGSIENNSVLDLFHCEINSINDYRRYKNALYEFKPKYEGYDFIVPSKNISKTIKKMKFFLKK